MLGVLKSIFGGGAVVKAGIEAIDKAFYTDQEAAADAKDLIELKSKVKTDLLTAYAPFKVAQRFLAIMFAGEFLLLLNVAIGMRIYGLPIDPLLELVDGFYLQYIMLSIVCFYFSGGMIEGVIGKIKKPAGLGAGGR